MHGSIPVPLSYVLLVDATAGARASEGVPALSASARRRRPGQRNGRAGLALAAPNGFPCIAHLSVVLPALCYRASLVTQ